MNTDLHNYIEELESTNPTDTAHFYRLIWLSGHILDLSDDEFADKFDTSLPAIRHWKNGKRAPQPVMRKHVYAFLIKRAKEML